MTQQNDFFYYQALIIMLVASIFVQGEMTVIHENVAWNFAQTIFCMILCQMHDAMNNKKKTTLGYQQNISWILSKHDMMASVWFWLEFLSTSSAY